MTRLFLLAALLASATTASASVTYGYHSTGRFGTTDWQFTVGDFLSAPGTTFITTFDSYSSNTLGSTLLSVQITDPFSTSPSVVTSGDAATLGSAIWVGPFDQAGVYIANNVTTNNTLTISSTNTPEPSSFSLIGAGGLLFGLVRRRGWTFGKNSAS